MNANARAETQSIFLEYDLPHPPAKVWRALTESELVAKWIMANDLKPQVGHAFTFRFGSEPTPMWDGIVHSEILESDPPKRLSYTWKSGPAPLDTVVTWTLTPTPSGGTKLALEQSGFVPANKFAFDGASQGWQYMLGSRLPEVLAAL
jgi:uncharacterized protein YndB with AHSA1/START domain